MWRMFNCTVSENLSGSGMVARRNRPERDWSAPFPSLPFSLSACFSLLQLHVGVVRLKQVSSSPSVVTANHKMDLASDIARVLGRVKVQKISPATDEGDLFLEARTLPHVGREQRSGGGNVDGPDPFICRYLHYSRLEDLYGPQLSDALL
jgi:hypothetical protein